MKAIINSIANPPLSQVYAQPQRKQRVRSTCALGLARGGRNVWGPFSQIGEIEVGGFEVQAFL